MAGLGSVGGWLRLRKKHATIPEGTPCANCATTLQGAYCHVCGQFATDYHRSIFSLCGDFIEGFFHLDGRLWRTLPNLLFKPGRLTRDYLDGKRVPQIPPFRLFLVCLLIVFFVGQSVLHSAGGDDPLRLASAIRFDQGEMVAIPNDPKAAEAINKANMELAREIKMNPSAARAEAWIKERVESIRKDPERFLLILEIWGHRVAILALPMMALFLTLLFVWRRKFYVYDHIIFSIHSITFHFLLLTGILLATLVIGSKAWWLALLSLVHVWFHMRKVYGTGIFGTVFRMIALGFGTIVGFAFLAVLWIFLGVSAMSGSS